MSGGMVKYGVIAKGLTNPESKHAQLDDCAAHRIVKEARLRTSNKKQAKTKQRNHADTGRRS